MLTHVFTPIRDKAQQTLRKSLVPHHVDKVEAVRVLAVFQGHFDLRIGVPAPANVSPHCVNGSTCWQVSIPSSQPAELTVRATPVRPHGSLDLLALLDIVRPPAVRALELPNLESNNPPVLDSSRLLAPELY